MAKESSTAILHVDDDNNNNFQFSSSPPPLLNHDQNERIYPLLLLSDEEYIEELQLQEALIASVSSTIQEIGEPSQITCEICVETKKNYEMFTNETCGHTFCINCINNHVEAKLNQDDDNNNMMMVPTIKCLSLNCKGVLEPDFCKAVISKDVLVRWDEAISRSMIHVSQRFYCPFKDCSALLVNDNGGEVIITESECPICRRLFCAQCYVGWHAGVECEEFRRENEEDGGGNEREREEVMVRELAKENKWRRCPRCLFYVEKTDGCLHITCRCKFEFCYGCGLEWAKHGGGCQEMEDTA